MPDRLRKLLEDAAASNGRLQAIRKRMEQGKATFADTAEYSELLSDLLGEIFANHVEQLTKPMEKETICKQLLQEHYESINKTLAKVQQELDAQREIHIRPQQATFPAERVQKVAHALEDPTVPLETIRRRANAPVANVAKSFHDDYVRENAKFRADAGLQCWITRHTDGNCCKWCTKAAGRYLYEDQPENLWRRHDNCGCTIIYDTGRTVQTLRGRHKKWEVVSERAKEYKPTILTPAQGRALQAKHRPTVLTKGSRSGIMETLDSIELFEGFEKFSHEQQKTIDEALAPIPKKLLQQLSDYVSGITLVDGRGYSSYVRDARLIVLDSQTGMKSIVHELGHAFGDMFGVYDDQVFLDILSEDLDCENWYDVIRASHPHRKEDVWILPSDKFINPYQGRIYADVSEVDWSAPIDLRLFREYISIGFDTYFSYPELLLERDPKLYQYLEGLING